MPLSSRGGGETHPVPGTSFEGQGASHFAKRSIPTTDDSKVLSPLSWSDRNFQDAIAP